MRAHNFSLYCRARPAGTAFSTAVPCILLIRMRPEVQVLPGPQIGLRPAEMLVTASKDASQSAHPVGDEVLNVLPLLSRNSASEQPLSGSTAVGMPQIVAAQRYQNASLCRGPSVGSSSKVTPTWRHLRDGAVAAADAGSVQPTRQVLMVLRRTSPASLSRTKWPRLVRRIWEPSSPVPVPCR
jgi:hypothetical protein